MSPAPAPAPLPPAEGSSSAGGTPGASLAALLSPTRPAFGRALGLIRLMRRHAQPALSEPSGKGAVRSLPADATQHAQTRELRMRRPRRTRGGPAGVPALHSLPHRNV